MSLGATLPLSGGPAPAARPHAAKFEATWRLITFALAMTAFLALATTGEIPFPAIAAFALVWLVGVMRTPPPAWWNPWAGRIVFVAGLAAISYPLLQFRFAGLLYLLIFLACCKLLALNKPIDHLESIIIAFIMLLACTAITNSMSYLFFMLAFLVLAMLDLICYSMAREAEQASRTAIAAVQGRRLKWRRSPMDGDRRAAMLGAQSAAQAHLAVLSQEPLFFGRLFLSHMAVALISLALALGIFLLLPHYSTQRLARGAAGDNAQPAPAASGFSDKLDLSAVSRLALDNTQVMSVGVAWSDESDRPLPAQLRLRGSNLSVFNEQGWSVASSLLVRDSTQWQLIHLPLDVSGHSPILVQNIRQNPLALRRLFGGGDPYYYEIAPGRDYDVDLNWDARTIDMTLRTQSKDWLGYVVYSVINPEGVVVLGRMDGAIARLSDSIVKKGGLELTSALRRIEPKLPSVDPSLVLTDSERALNVALPQSDLIEKIRPLAAEHAAGSNVAQRALNLQHWLQTDFQYSLVPDTPRGMHPIEGFLLHTHKGHCEYFASSEALLLRIMDIPARVVTGYFASDFDPSSGQFLVKQSDAHAWVEIWIDGWGWLTLDPTPPEYRGRGSTIGYSPPFFQTLAGRLRTLWQSYVLDYTNDDRPTFVTRFLQRPLTENFVRLGAWARGLAISNLYNHSAAHENLLKLGHQSLYIGLRTAVAIVLLAFIWAVYRRSLNRRRLAEAARRSPVAYMNQLLQQLEAMGWRREACQTPAELIRAVDRETGGKWPLARILDLYHQNRFAGELPSHADMSWIHRSLRSIHR